MVQRLVKFIPNFYEDEIDTYESILNLMESSDFETRNLGRIMFRTTKFYKNNNPIGTWIEHPWLEMDGSKHNLKFLLSNSYTFSPGNCYYVIVIDLIKSLVDKPIINYYHYAD